MCWSMVEELMIYLPTFSSSVKTGQTKELKGVSKHKRKEKVRNECVDSNSWFIFLQSTLWIDWRVERWWSTVELLIIYFLHFGKIKELKEDGRGAMIYLYFPTFSFRSLHFFAIIKELKEGWMYKRKEKVRKESFIIYSLCCLEIKVECSRQFLQTVLLIFFVDLMARLSLTFLYGLVKNLCFVPRSERESEKYFHKCECSLVK